MKEFPVRGLLPKEETQAANFLRKYPTYDGRGVVIAILDTGVDPAAGGLQVTTDGKPKIIDIIDCTGSGDVVLSAPQKVESDGTLLTSSGKVLKLNPQWKNPTGEYRIGSKLGYSLFPKELVGRLSEKNKKQFEIEHNKLVSAVMKRIQQFDSDHNGVLTEEQLEFKSDLEAQLSELKDAMSNYQDIGPVYDCVVFHDGTTWRVAIDLMQNGDLSNVDALADYSVEHQYLKFSEESNLTFSVKFYDDGETLSIVTSGGSHGTHVAAICAANFPDDPAINGVAPGAQIISLKIGDTRLKTMETGTGLFRALQSMLAHKCDIANMSYGEDANVANSGFWQDLLKNELINKAQITFVSSAGNAGPALSTAGAPGGTCEGVIGVGAYVTNDMMSAEYCLVENSNEVPFTWSSRGPALDGDRGVSVYCPGAAITSVPQYLLKNGQLMNGTSMSSPNACGNISLIISALKQLKVNYSPYRLKKVIENTSKNINDPMMAGLLQVDDAFNHLIKYKDDIDQDVLYEIRVGSNEQRGIYLRESFECESVYQTSVSVNAVFKQDDVTLNDQKVKLEQRLTFIPTHPWIKTPEHLLFNSGGRDFQVKIDPTKLKSGFHYGEIHAFESSNIEKGIIFRVPVSVTNPDISSDAQYSFTQSYAPGQVDRKFVQVPNGATWAEIVISNLKTDVSCRLVVHLVQKIPQQKHSRTEAHWYIAMTPDKKEFRKSFKVIGGLTMEICTAQFWSTATSNEFSYDFQFHGLQVNSDQVCFSASQIVQRLDVVSLLRTEKISIEAKLDSVRKSVRPEKSIVRPLKSRDTLPNGQFLSELELSYKVKLSETQTVTFLKPLVDEALYESGFDSVLLMCHDCNNQFVLFDDVYPKAKKLAKGDYTIRLQLRHFSVSTLEQFKQMCLVCEFKLEKSESISVYSTRQDLASGKDALKFRNYLIKAGEQVPFFLAFTNTGLKSVTYGDVLVGKLKLFDSDIEGGQFEVQVVVPPACNEASKPENPTPLDIGQMDKDVMLQQINWISKLKESSDKKQIVQKLEGIYGDKVEYLVAKLNYLFDSSKEDLGKVLQNAPEIKVICDKIMSALDEKASIEYSGTKVKLSETAEAQTKKKEMDALKKNLSISRFYSLLMDLLLIQKDGRTEAKLKSLTEKWNQFFRYLDLTDSKHVLLAIFYEKVNERYGSALKILNKYIQDNGSSVIKDSMIQLLLATYTTKDSSNKQYQLLRIELLKCLGWKCWESYENQLIKAKFPDCTAPF